MAEQSVTTEQAFDLAWQAEMHHIDAYVGYPDVQQDILATRAAELLAPSVETVQPDIPKTIYLATSEPVIMHAARTGRETERTDKIGQIIAKNPQIHLEAMLEQLSQLRLDQRTAAGLVVSILQGHFDDDSEERQLLDKSWDEAVKVLDRFRGHVTLVKTTKIS